MSSALRMALRESPLRPGCIFHSDLGIEYAAQDYCDLVQSAGMVRSMSRKGNPLDNAHMESYFHTLRAELIHQQFFGNVIKATAKIVRHIEFFIIGNVYTLL